MKKFFFLFLAISLTLVGNAIAENLKTIDELKGFTQSFIEKIAAGDSKAAVDYLGPYSVIRGSDLNVLTPQIQTQMLKIEASYGICVGTEFISIEQLGNSLIKIIQLQKFNVYAVRWMLIFYNNGSGWKVVNVSFDDKIPDLFKN
jgi:hypothetical protein